MKKIFYIIIITLFAFLMLGAFSDSPKSSKNETTAGTVIPNPDSGVTDSSETEDTENIEVEDGGIHDNPFCTIHTGYGTDTFCDICGKPYYGGILLDPDSETITDN